MAKSRYSTSGKLKRQRSFDGTGQDTCRAQRHKGDGPVPDFATDQTYAQGPLYDSPRPIDVDHDNAGIANVPIPTPENTADYNRTEDPPGVSWQPSGASGLATKRIRKGTLRARLQDAVRIIWRQVQIEKLIAPLFNDSELSGQSSLCDVCRDLRLDATDFVMRGGKSFSETGRVYGGDLRLGTLSEINLKARDCPLCRLIIKSLAEQPYAKLINIVNSAKQSYKTGDVAHKERRGPLNMRAVCKAKWMVDGHVTIPGKDGLSIAKPEHRTRRLRLEWNDKCFEEAYLVMMDPPTGKTSSAFLGRVSLRTNRTKLQLISTWMSKCEREHGEGCGADRSERHRFDELRGESYFGVIDVVEMRLTKLPENGRYVALSYNWGEKKDERFKTTRNTVEKIMKRNGLSDYLRQIPATIVQTFELVRSLGLRYVWIDSLCIVQDSPAAWDRNSIVMDLVYGNAYLTVCAADGEDAHAGLKALKDGTLKEGPLCGRQILQIFQEIRPGLNLMVSYPCEMYVQKSKWSKRGWTFQERLLSKRCLLFTEGRMYFQCCSTTMSEDIDMETPTAGLSVDHPTSPMKDFQGVAKDPVAAYMDSVKLYTARELSQKNDILAAFYGISQLICKYLGGVPLYGLPNSHFDLALLWEAHDAPVRRKCGPRTSFPSWSWCGWAERYMLYRDDMVEDFKDDIQGWLMNHTWINWYIRDDSGRLRLVWDAKANSRRNNALEKRLRGYSVENADSPVYDYYGRKIPPHMIGQERHEFTLKTLDFPIQVTTLPRGETGSRLMGQTRDLGILQFWTWSAYLQLTSETPVVSSSGDPGLGGRIFSRRYTIMDSNCNPVGTIVLDPTSNFDKWKPQQFIAISDARKFSAHEGHIDRNYPVNNSGPWSLYNVLMIGHDVHNDSSRTSGNDGVDCRDENIAYRLGLGKVYKEAFDHSCTTFDQPEGKMWREIVLG